MRDAAQLVAVKILNTRRSEEWWSARFQRYLAATAGIEPITARVVDVGLSGTGEGYVVTEFIPGRTILSHCLRARLPADVRLRTLADVCTAIDHAHRWGMVHGHVVPANVIVASATINQVRVLDFAVGELSGDSVPDPREDLAAVERLATALLQAGGEGTIGGIDWRGIRATVSRAARDCNSAADLAAALHAVADQNSGPYA